MRTQYDHDYPPGEWTAESVTAALQSAPEAYPVPSYDDERAWERIREDDLVGPLAERIVDEAEAVRDEPVPRLPASLYLDYARTDDRGTYQDPERRRRRRLSVLTLAECFEREGRYLDAILDYAWAICEQATWVLPAHLPGDVGSEGLARPVAPAENHVALRPAGLGKNLAEVDHLLGERLHPALRERIRHEVEERLLTPYEAREDFGWLDPPTNNWNAVCNAGPAIAALYLLDDHERAGRIVAKAAGSLRHYLADFDPDGCTAEGIGYWNYGFGNYVQLAVHLATRTDGACDLLSVPVVEEIATYPLRVELSPGHHLPFSDAYEATWPDPYIACRLGERFDEPGLLARGRAAVSGGGIPKEKAAANVRTLAWCAGLPDPSPPAQPPRRFLAGYDWWIARAEPGDPDGLVVAAKGGHNGESHNHNDCGSFVVHRGRESLLTDLGKPTYTGSYFGEERYDHLAARSLGHSVPYVNGHEQVAGAEHAAEVIERREGDREEALALELAGCYPDAADLETLRREVGLDRERERVRVTDRAAFGEAGSFESVLISSRPMSVVDGHVEVAGDRSTATVTPEGATDVRVEQLEGAIDTAGHKTAASDPVDVWRARLDAERGSQAELSFTVSVR